MVDPFARGMSVVLRKWKIRDKLADVMLALANRGSWLFYVVLANYLVSAWLFKLAEHHPYLRSLWWAIVTGFTVGYGDIYPSTQQGQAIGSWLIISSWLLSLLLGAYITARVLINKHKYTDREQRAMAASNLRIELALGTLPPGTTELPVPDDAIPDDE